MLNLLKINDFSAQLPDSDMDWVDQFQHLNTIKSIEQYCTCLPRSKSHRGQQHILSDVKLLSEATQLTYWYFLGFPLAGLLFTQ